MSKALRNNEISSDIVTPSKKRSIYYVGKFSHVVGKTWTDAEIRAMADELLEWMEDDESRVWLKGWFIEKHIPYITAERLMEKNDYFAEVFGMCRDLQEQRLVDMGLSGKGRTAMVIFCLKQKIHGWKDKADPEDETDDHELIVDWPGMDKHGHPLPDDPDEDGGDDEL
jgi:hypothetical protein